MIPILESESKAMHLEQPLSDKEFNELDKFLLSDRCGDDGMAMDSLHGYLTALAIGPEIIPLAEWLPNVWGVSARQTPAFKTEKECDRIISLIARFMHEIAITLEVAPKEFEPLFCEYEAEGRTVLDGEAWAWGFWEGIQLREEAWQPIWDSELAPLMKPLYLLGAEQIDDDECVLVDTPLKCHKLTIEIEAAIPHIHQYWLPFRKSLVEQNQRSEAKAGRNDECACGSGKKFKKCCGAPPVVH
jgi:uncharacterized protein